MRTRLQPGPHIFLSRQRTESPTCDCLYFDSLQHYHLSRMPGKSLPAINKGLQFLESCRATMFWKLTESQRRPPIGLTCQTTITVRACDLERHSHRGTVSVVPYYTSVMGDDRSNWKCSRLEAASRSERQRPRLGRFPRTCHQRIRPSSNHLYHALHSLTQETES